MKIVLISGKAQHGKDTTAECLKAELECRGCRVLTTHFADVLKFVCKNLFHWDGQKDERGRRLLQVVGTDIVRKQDTNFWVRFIRDLLSMFDGSGGFWDYVIIPDCRFPNELELMRERFPYTYHVRVVRPGFESPLTPEQQAHPSETAMDGVQEDYLIKNEGDIEDLRAAVLDFADWMETQKCER